MITKLKADRAPISPTDLARFSDLVRRASGIEVTQARYADLEQAVQQALVASAAADTDALYRNLTQESGRPALEAMVAALTIGETHFFRNRPQFEALRNHILPEIIRRRRDTRQLRLWSAGCATGEEPYSLAILVEALLPDLDQWQVLILATDINRKALQKAQRGVYTSWSFREVPPNVQETYFTPVGRGYEIAPRLRERVTFAYLNLVEDTYPSLLTSTHAMDLILFRNVLIYFREPASRHVVARLYGSLVEDGWLVAGHADPTPGVFDEFIVHNFPGAVIYRKRTARVTPPAPAAMSWLEAVPRSALPETPATSAGSNAARPALPVPQSPINSDPYGEALTFWQRGQPDEALKRLAAFAESAPADARAPYLAAKIQADRGHLAAAEVQVEAALRRDSLLPQAHYLHGLILQETGRVEAALAAQRRCIYADPQFVLSHYASAVLLVRTGQLERARKLLDNTRRWLAGRPNSELVPEGDGLTVGRLAELVTAQMDLAGQKEPA